MKDSKCVSLDNSAFVQLIGGKILSFTVKDAADGAAVQIVNVFPKASVIKLIQFIEKAMPGSILEAAKAGDLDEWLIEYLSREEKDEDAQQGVTRKRARRWMRDTGV